MLCGLLTPSAWAAEPPSADALLQAVRRSSTNAINLVLDGRLRQDRAQGRVVEPFQVIMEGPRITFAFEKGRRQRIVLDLAPAGFALHESINGGPFKPVPHADFGKPIRSMDVNYLDISLAYLYWPNPKYMGEDRVNRMLAWKVRVDSPHEGGPYDHMVLWVNQETGALLRIVGYDQAAKPVKQMEVMDVQKIRGEGGEDMWMLKKMKIYAKDTTNDNSARLTYMEFDRK